LNGEIDWFDSLCSEWGGNLFLERSLVGREVLNRLLDFIVDSEV
jgi:hypothetical protein